MTCGRQKAFTLIEVLVALSVFGVLSMLAYMTLGQSLSNADMLTERMDRLQSVQRAMRHLGNDITQAAPRPVRWEVGDTMAPAVFSSLAGQYALEVTHSGWSNPVGLPRGTMQRSAYRLENDELLRYHWNVLDRTFANEPVATVLLDGVESLLFRFLQADGAWVDSWPPQDLENGAGLRDRPRAVEIVLTLADEGELTRLVEVAP
jgi:general secretion pathway protein J